MKIRAKRKKNLHLGVTQQTISYRLKSLGMIQKQGNWVSHELKPRNVERFFTCEMLLTRYKRKGFLHRIVTGDEKWIHYDNKEEEIMEITWLCFNIDSQAEYSWKKKLMLCIWWSAWCRVL